MREGHSVQGSKSEVTAQHHQDLTFESPTQVFVSMELPQNVIYKDRIPEP